MKRNALVDVRIVCDAPNYLRSYYRQGEELAAHLSKWCDEFNEFIRDHRSQDPVVLSVEREYQMQCSHCGREWEEDDEGPICCNAAQEEWMLDKTKEESQ